MRIINRDYLTSGSFITFLWRPKRFFTNLKNQPVIGYPFLFIFLAHVLLFSSFFTELYTLKDIIDVSIFNPLSLSGILISIPVIFFYLFYLIVQNRQSVVLILSVVLHVFLAAMYYILFIEFLELLVDFTYRNNLDLVFVGLVVVIYFTYLAFGLFWGLDGTTLQFWIGYIFYVILSILLAFALVWIIGYMIMTVAKGVKDFFEFFIVE